MQKILKKYLDRLHDSIQRSALLRAYPPKEISTLLDLHRLSKVDQELPTTLLETLIYEKGKTPVIHFEYDELPCLKQEIDDLKEKNQTIPDDLQKQFDHLKGIERLHAGFINLIKGSDLLHRETGLRSLWLGYPLAYVRSPKNSILAPIFLWPISIKVSIVDPIVKTVIEVS